MFPAPVRSPGGTFHRRCGGTSSSTPQTASAFVSSSTAQTGTEVSLALWRSRYGDGGKGDVQIGSDCCGGWGGGEGRVGPVRIACDRSGWRSPFRMECSFFDDGWSWNDGGIKRAAVNRLGLTIGASG